MAFDIKKVNGLGDGSLGDVTITNAATQLNSYANVTTISADGKTLTVNMSGASIGTYGGFLAGQDIMFHVSGCLTSAYDNKDRYSFARILSTGINQIVLDTAVPIIDLNMYICQIITVPNFNNLTIKCALSAVAFDTNKKYGGIIIAKSKNQQDLTAGSLLAEKKGLPKGSSLKPAGIKLSNSDLTNKWPLNQGGGIVCIISQSLLGSANTRLGASWNGSLGAGKGTGGRISLSGRGGAGYGGAGGNTWNYTGGTANGTIGGRGAAEYYEKGNVGGDGGLQGYSGVTINSTLGGDAGATIILIVNNIIGFSLDIFSSGGDAGGYGDTDRGAGGGGAGYGYIATNTVSFPSNTVAYALDILNISKKALIQSKKVMDCSKATSVDGFDISSIQPAGTDTRVLFSLGTARVAGSRTFPITTNAVAGDTVTIAGVTMTAVASGATGNQFNVGTTIAATAVNIAMALNATTTFNSIYSASTDSNGVITVSENSSHVGYGNNPAAATKTGTIAFGTGTVTTSIPTWFKLTAANGVASMTTAVPTQDLTADSVLAEGNTIADLTGITSIPAFVGNQIYIAEVHLVPNGATVAPMLKLALKGHNNQDQYQKDEISAEYTLSDNDVEIVSVTADVTTTGQATAAVTVSLKQAGTWSGYMSMIDAKGQKGSAIKYKTTCTVTKLDGTDSAQVNKVSVIYCAGSNTVSGDTADILTITQDYENGIGFAECLVKHKKLMDAEIRSYVSLRSAPKKREMIPIGIGNGETQTVKVGIKDGQGNIVPDTGINHNTLSVQFDGKPNFGYGYNTETSELTFTAETGVAVTASYEHGWESETWVEMAKATTQVYNDTGYYGTKFEYEVPSTVTGKTISNMKTVLYRPSGTVTDETIGTATGQRQLIVLPHYAKKESIVCTGSWSYDDSSRILTVVDNKGNAIKISYNWLAETHEIYGLTAGWAEAE